MKFPILFVVKNVAKFKRTIYQDESMKINEDSLVSQRSDSTWSISKSERSELSPKKMERERGRVIEDSARTRSNTHRHPLLSSAMLRFQLLPPSTSFLHSLLLTQFSRFSPAAVRTPRHRVWPRPFHPLKFCPSIRERDPETASEGSIIGAGCDRPWKPITRRWSGGLIGRVEMHSCRNSLVRIFVIRETLYYPNTLSFEQSIYRCERRCLLSNSRVRLG